MRCLHCGDDATYNRAVTDVQTGDQIGGYCSACERDTFGRTLSDELIAVADSCVLCARNSAYALPVHQIEIDLSGPQPSEVEHYLVTEETPKLCRVHANTVLDTDAPSPAKEPVPLVTGGD